MKHIYFRNWKINVILIFTLLSNVVVFGQGHSIQGKVTTATGEIGIPGVTVVVKGTQAGSLTNAEGEYEINASSGQVLIFSFLGYKSKEVTVGSESKLNVVLEDDVTMLNEVVAVGYGSQSRQTVTTSVAKPDTKEPGLIEMKDGSILMHIRTDRGMQYASYSKGKTWQMAIPYKLPSPLSPATIVRDPATKQLVAIWNNFSVLVFAPRVPVFPLQI